MSTGILIVLGFIAVFGGVGAILFFAFKAAKKTSGKAEAVTATMNAQVRSRLGLKTSDLRDPRPTHDCIDCFPTQTADGRKLNISRVSDNNKLAKYALPPMATIDEMARMMGTTSGELRWLMSENGDHYSRVEIKNRNGKRRLLFPPKTKLKACQRWILRNVLDKVPLHKAAEGFRKGRSIVSHAKNHTSKNVVYAMDISKFFDTVKSKRVYGVFRRLGYSEEASLAFALLTTRLGRLPQGAPTSPALANLVCHRMDARLTGLARKYNAAYSRYADDMAFSGGPDFAEKWRAFRFIAKKIVKESGFELNASKTKTMKSTGPQRVTGVTVNTGANVNRKMYRTMRAIIHNAQKNGLDSQNRKSHPSFREYLKGKIAFVHMIRPDKAAKLKAALEKVA